jgi:hypothetical protein
VTRSRWRRVAPRVFLAALGVLAWHGWSRLDHRPLRVMQTPVGEAREVLRLHAGDKPASPPTFHPGAPWLVVSAQGTNGVLSPVLRELRRPYSLWGFRVSTTDNTFPEDGIQHHYALDANQWEPEPVRDIAGHVEKAITHWDIAYGCGANPNTAFLAVLDRAQSQFGEPSQAIYSLSLCGNWERQRWWFAVSPAATLVAFPHDSGLWLLRLRKPISELVKEAERTLARRGRQVP